MRSQCYVRRWLTSPASSAHTVGDRMETTDDDIFMSPCAPPTITNEIVGKGGRQAMWAELLRTAAERAV